MEFLISMVIPTCSLSLGTTNLALRGTVGEMISIRKQSLALRSTTKKFNFFDYK
jgi:hypothetical protein